MLESFVKSRKLLAPGKGDVPEYKNGTKVIKERISKQKQ